MNETKALLERWIRSLLAKLPRIANEDHINCFMWPIHPLNTKGDTLLEILGYLDGEVTAQETMPAATTSWRFDFVVRRNGSPLLIIEDKSPKKTLDDHMGQVVDYFLKIPAPIGMLFNGNCIKLLVNTNLEGLREFVHLKNEWVAEVALNDAESMVDLLSQLSAESLGSDAVGVAKRLANKRVEDDRKNAIAHRAQEIREKPSAEHLDAIIKADAELSNLNAKPEELAEAWTNTRVPVTGNEGRAPQETPPPVAGTGEPDRAYWVARTSEIVMRMVDECLSVVREINPSFDLHYKREHIGLESEGHVRNFLRFDPKGEWVRVYAKVAESERASWSGRLEDAGLSVYPHGAPSLNLVLKAGQGDVAKNHDLLKELFRVSYKECGAGGNRRR